jgi:DNA-binding MarR family transcriptional regulator
MQFELQNFLPYRLSLLTNTVSQGMAGSYTQKHDINITEWRILAVLGRYPGLTASQVVEKTAMDKVAISRGVKSLMSRKLLKRQTDPNDRRRRRLYLTNRKGQKVMEQVIPQARQYEQRLLEALDPEETKALLLILDKLQQQSEALNQVE